MRFLLIILGITIPLFLSIFVYMYILREGREQTLQMMIEQTPPGKPLVLKPGIYRENILIVDKNISLIGYEVVLKSVKRNKPVIFIKNSKVVLEGLRVENSTGQCYDLNRCASGILILNSEVLMKEVTIKGNAGVGILSVNSTLRVINSAVIGNEGDGIELQSSHLEILNATISGNEWHGLSVFNSYLSALNIFIMDNKGNGLSSRNSKIEMRNVTLSNNRYDGLGLIDTNLSAIRALIMGNKESGVFALNSELGMKDVKVIKNRINGITLLTSVLGSSNILISGSRVGVLSRNSDLKLVNANICVNNKHGIFASESILKIYNSSIDRSDESNIYITYSSLKLANSSIRNSEVGIRIENSHPYLTGSLIEGNKYGIVLMGNSSFKLMTSRIVNNEYGIAAHVKKCGFLWDYFHRQQEKLTIVKSLVKDNKVDLCPKEYFITSRKS